VKQKRDTAIECASRILVKGDVPTERVSHLSKGRRALWRRVSLLLNMHTKKKAYKLVSTGMLLAPTRSVPVGTRM
jgi:hypothetical protein